MIGSRGSMALVMVVCIGCSGDAMPVAEPAATPSRGDEPRLPDDEAAAPGNESADMLDTVIATDESAEPTAAEEAATEVEAPVANGRMDLPLGGGLRLRPMQVSPIVADLIARARRSMAGRDLLTASSMLQRMPADDPGSDDAKELERVWLLSRFLVKFWSAVRESAASLRPGTKLRLADQEAVVAAVEGGTATLKLADGSEQQFPLTPAMMPAEFAEALARHGLLSSGPVADRMIAAFHVLDHDGSRERAAELCRRMQRHGLNVDLLLPEL